MRWNKTKPRNYDKQQCPGELSIGIPPADEVIACNIIFPQEHQLGCVTMEECGTSLMLVPV